MVENAITKVARIAAHAAQGLVYKDSAGKEQTILPTGDKNTIDISGLSIGSGSGGDNGDSNHPNVGNDYYPGSVYDGTISGRTLLYSGVTSTTDKTNIVFPESVGAGLRLLGDGIQLRLKLLKTLVTRGVVDTSSTEIPLVYDILDKQVKGSFVTVAPLPASITKDNILSGNELVIPLDGIGEGEQSTEVKSPELHLQYDSKTNSINVWNVQGYSLDNLTDTKTGNLYNIELTLINSFYVQDSVSQLPADMNLFTGDTDGEIELAGINRYFDNIGDFIEIEVENYLYFNGTCHTSNGVIPESNERISLAQFNISNKFKISKYDLIVGNQVNIEGSIPGTLTSFQIESYIANRWMQNSQTGATITVNNQAITIKDGKIEMTLNITLDYKSGSNTYYLTGAMKVLNVKTSKEGE
jgi:hypothetical protein